MKEIILFPNATPIYNFLSFITYKVKDHKDSKILDCGAGGKIPPLYIFYKAEFDCFGIDISSKSLENAKKFCRDYNCDIYLKEGDMRNIEFDDNFFDFVYEHYSMCHLSKKDTEKAISEMNRVLKKEGIAFLGFISRDTWPISGDEESPGEFIENENGESVRHSYFLEEETEKLLSKWDILFKEKREITNHQFLKQITFEEWKDVFGNANETESRKLFDQRFKRFKYSHLYYIVQKK